MCGDERISYIYEAIRGNLDNSLVCSLYRFNLGNEIGVFTIHLQIYSPSLGRCKIGNRRLLWENVTMF